MYVLGSHVDELWHVLRHVWHTPLSKSIRTASLDPLKHVQQMLKNAAEPSSGRREQMLNTCSPNRCLQDGARDETWKIAPRHFWSDFWAQDANFDQNWSTSAPRPVKRATIWRAFVWNFVRRAARRHFVRYPLKDISENGDGGKHNDTQTEER